MTTETAAADRPQSSWACSRILAQSSADKNSVRTDLERAAKCCSRSGAGAGCAHGIAPPPPVASLVSAKRREHVMARSGPAAVDRRAHMQVASSWQGEAPGRQEED